MNKLKIMYAFQLWREFKLSIAEIFAIFPNGKTVYFNKEILILEKLDKNDILNKINNLWWVIKVIEIEESNNLNIEKFILEKNINIEWKLKYSINIFWEKLNLKKLLNKTKSLLKENGISSRFVNKDFKNLNSSQIIWEKLIIKETDYNLINTKENIYIWKSIWIQDIKSYSKRDWQKNRDMQTWMLPPKLAQIMINFSSIDWKIKLNLYDPFVWLWTVLIEWILMWIKNIYWSDLSEKMVEYSINNVLSLKKDLKTCKIFKHNAKFILELDFLNSNKIDSIVTEWYLWEIMTHKNINLERIEKQRKKLQDLYEWFFSWLKQVWYKWNIVISFPFWKLKWKYIYFNEIYDILNKYCDIQKLFPKDFELQESKVWSLLYKRDKQLVGREIFKLKMK